MTFLQSDITISQTGSDWPLPVDLVSILWVVSREWLATVSLVELLQCLDRLVGRRDELLTLA